MREPVTQHISDMIMIGRPKKIDPYDQIRGQIYLPYIVLMGLVAAICIPLIPPAAWKRSQRK